MFQGNGDEIQEVPGANPVYYDPSHPDADWSGFVPKGSAGRRHHSNPAAMRQNITSSKEHGLTPADSTRTQDVHRSQRRVVGPHRQSCENLIGGVGPVDPSERFRTQYQATTAMEPTPLDVMTDKTRGQHITTKKLIAPPYETPRQDGRLGTPPNQMDFRRGSHSGGQGGVRRTSSPLNAGPSMLSGLAQQLAADQGISQARDLARKGPVDEGLQKELYTSNYHLQMPGYTGGRK